MKIKLIKSIFFIAILILTINCSSAPNKKEPKTLMWEVNSENGGKVFILGSIHLADSTLYPLHNSIERNFDSSDALVLEILVDQVSPTEVMKYLTFKDERTLETELDPEIYQKIAEKFEKNNIPKFMYNKFKPWFAVMFLQSDAFKSSGFTATEGIDMYFLSKARDKKMEVMEIESLAQQMEVMDELGEFTGDYLKYVLDETESSEEAVKELIRAWKEGDDKAMENMVSQGNDKKEYSQVMEKLNYKRNVKMVDKIEEYLKTDKKYFIVVGTAHVIGERGVVDLLNKKNKYKIIRY